MVDQSSPSPSELNGLPVYLKRWLSYLARQVTEFHRSQSQLQAMVAQWDVKFDRMLDHRDLKLDRMLDQRDVKLGQIMEKVDRLLDVMNVLLKLQSDVKALESVPQQCTEMKDNIAQLRAVELQRAEKVDHLSEKVDSIKVDVMDLYDSHMEFWRIMGPSQTSMSNHSVPPTPAMSSGFATNDFSEVPDDLLPQFSECMPQISGSIYKENVHPTAAPRANSLPPPHPQAPSQTLSRSQSSSQFTDDVRSQAPSQRSSTPSSRPLSDTRQPNPPTLDSGNWQTAYQRGQIPNGQQPDMGSMSTPRDPNSGHHMTYQPVLQEAKNSQQPSARPTAWHPPPVETGASNGARPSTQQQERQNTQQIQGQGQHQQPSYGSSSQAISSPFMSPMSQHAPTPLVASSGVQPGSQQQDMQKRQKPRHHSNRNVPSRSEYQDAHNSGGLSAFGRLSPPSDQSYGSQTQQLLKKVSPYLSTGLDDPDPWSIHRTPPYHTRSADYGHPG